MTPEISVIVPCYNQDFYLAKAIRSVQAQTYNKWELIIVDDGSTDETHSIAIKFHDPRIRYLYQQNQGLSAARNTGIRAANAQIIALLDSDDLWKTTFLERMLECLIRNPGAAAVYCGHAFMDARGCEIGNPCLKVVPPRNFRQILIYKGNWLVPSAVVFKKYPAEQEGFFDGSLGGCADTDFWYRLSKGRNFIGIDEILVRYRIHETSMSMNPEYMVSDFQRFIIKICGLSDYQMAPLGQFKKNVYTTFYRYAAWKYGMAGDFKKSVNYFLQLYELSPVHAISMWTWRTFARIHLPPEGQGRKLSKNDHSASIRSINSILDEISFQVRDKNISPAEIRRIQSCAYLALAEESTHSRFFHSANKYLWRSVKCFPSILLARRYWGTLLREVITALRFRKLTRREI